MISLERFADLEVVPSNGGIILVALMVSRITSGRAQE
jgi:hypothetical protein